MEKQPCVYILASGRNGTLYVGVTSNLLKRVYEHRTHAAPGVTSRYNVHALVWYQSYETMESAILREKQLKKWNRTAKLRLIECNDPTWKDLWTDLTSRSPETGYRQSLPK